MTYNNNFDENQEMLKDGLYLDVANELLELANTRYGNSPRLETSLGFEDPFEPAGQTQGTDVDYSQIESDNAVISGYFRIKEEFGSPYSNPEAWIRYRDKNGNDIIVEEDAPRNKQGSMVVQLSAEEFGPNVIGELTALMDQGEFLLSRYDIETDQVTIYKGYLGDGVEQNWEEIQRALG